MTQNTPRGSRMVGSIMKCGWLNESLGFIRENLLLRCDWLLGGHLVTFFSTFVIKRLHDWTGTEKGVLVWPALAHMSLFPDIYPFQSNFILARAISEEKKKRLKRCSTKLPPLTISWGTRAGALVRALAFHQCGPGSNPGIDAICGLSLLLVLSFAPRVFSLRTPVFPSPQKPTFPNSNSISNRVGEEPLCGCATSKSLLFL